jgi:hypothetical protein
MPTLYSAWQGTSFQARIRLDYTVTYTADRTQAIYDGTFYVEFGGSISDSVNTWAVSGDCGASSGSNIAYSIPSGGGVKAFKSLTAWQQYGDASVTGKIDNVEAVGGGIITGTFALPSGGLAPYFTDGSYAASAITSTGATISGWAASGNGGTLNNLQVQYNTSASATGATTVTRGAYAASQALTGLTPATLYYARVRFSNSTYGYGAWGGWAAFTTLSTIPGAPANTWYFASVNQTDVTIGGITVPYNGGAAIDQILVRYSTDPTFTTYTDATFAGSVTSALISGLNPGTTYYFRIFAHNVNGYSSPTTDQSTTTLPGVLVNVAGVWKVAIPYININGIWKPATRFVNVGGVWKQ